MRAGGIVRGLLVLVATAVLWWAVLWLAIAPDLAKRSHFGLIGLHAVPPVLVWVLWWSVMRWRRQKAADEAAEKEKQAEAERQAKREAARQERKEALRRQQYGCDCRAVAISHVRLAPAAPPELGLEAEAVSLREDDAEEAPEEGGILEHLRPGLVDALSQLYTLSAAALHFPIYLRPPSEVSAEEAFACVRAIREVDLGAPAAELPLFFLPQADSVANAAIALFENAPDLPGAVVLAFDSPWLRAPGEDDDEYVDPRRKAAERWIGAPGQGVFALLLTNPELPRMLAALDDQTGAEGYDAMTPYWERAFAPGSQNRILALLSRAERQELGAVPVLARVHRAATGTLGQHRNRSLAMAQEIAPLIERARLSAALLQALDETGAEGQVAPAESAAPPAPECGWLIHNAGGVDCSGNRVASLGVTLVKQGIDLDPIDCASNVVVQLGALGQAHSVGMLALTVAKAATEGLAALCAEYAGEHELAFYFAVPATDA